MQAVTTPAPNLFISRADVEELIRSSHPENITDVLRKIAKPLLAIAQGLLRPCAFRLHPPL